MSKWKRYVRCENKVYDFQNRKGVRYGVFQSTGKCVN